jgi:glycosyltransferase involved in cell wall biosynthesis
MTISLIVPLHQDNEDSRRALKGFAALIPAPFELIAVLDGTNETLAAAAAECGFKTLVLPSRSGPAKTRNAAAAQAEGDILLFVDSDVLTPRDLITRVKSTFDKHPNAAAIFGSYDDAPGDPGFLSQYKNLQHYYVHQTANASAGTFWTGCGAVRRKYFLERNGFAEKFGRPCIEDVEFGIRLKNAGHYIHLEKSLQVKHLKKYTAKSLLHSDFFNRALPWSWIILQQRHMPNDLNVDWKNRLGVISAYGFLFTLIAAMITAKVLFLAPTLACALLLLFLNRGFYRFLARKKGLLFLVKCIPWHWLYFLYGGLGFGCAFVSFHWHNATAFSRHKKSAGNSPYEQTTSP